MGLFHNKSKKEYSNQTFDKDTFIDFNDELVRFDSCEFKDVLIFENTNDKVLSFINCTFTDKVYIKKSNSKFDFADCNFIKKFDVFGFEGEVRFFDSVINNLVLKRSDIRLISFVQSEFENIYIRDVANILEIIISKSIGSRIILEFAIVNLLSMHDSFVDFVDLKTSNNTVLDLRNTKINEISLSDEIISRIIKRNYEKVLRKGDGNFRKKLENVSNSLNTLNIIHSSLENSKQYNYSDKIFIRIMELKVKKELYKNSNILKKTYALFKLIFLGYFFGWGVQVYNTIITIISTIFFFAAVYVFSPNIETYELKGNIFVKALYISARRLLSIGGDEVYSKPLLYNFEYLESFIGILLMTILTSVIVRKIIRN